MLIVDDEEFCISSILNMVKKTGFDVDNKAD